MAEWTVHRLDDVATVVMGSSPPGETYNETGDGLPFIQGSAEFGEQFPTPVKWCSAPIKVAEKGDLMVSVRAPVGDSNMADQRIAIGRGLAVVRGTKASNTFLRLVIQHSTESLLARSGSGMFSSITAKELRGLEVALPSSPEQRRIVDIMAVVDGHIEALETEARRVRGYLEAVATEELQTLSETIRFSDVATIRSGPSWAAQDESKEPRRDALRVVKITNTKSDGSLDMSDETYVEGLPASTLTLDDRSIVLIRTNGNRSRIGNAYVPTGEAIGCAVSAFQFIVKVEQPSDRDFLYWVLRERGMQAKMTEAASGTTGLGNLASGWLKKTDLPWSSTPDVRAGVVQRCQSVSTVAKSLADEVLSMRQVRAALLSGLLSQEIAVPESYDAGLEAAS